MESAMRVRAMRPLLDEFRIQAQLVTIVD